MELIWNGVEFERQNLVENLASERLIVLEYEIHELHEILGSIVSLKINAELSMCVHHQSHLNTYSPLLVLTHSSALLSNTITNVNLTVPVSNHEHTKQHSPR